METLTEKERFEKFQEFKRTLQQRLDERNAKLQQELQERKEQERIEKLNAEGISEYSDGE